MKFGTKRTAKFAATLFSLAAVLGGCGLFRELGVGGDDPKWVERRYRGVSSGPVLKLAETAFRDRYPPNEVDPARGTLASGWVYGKWADTTHQALRARILIETQGEEDVLVVRLRVQQETSQSAGRGGDRDVDDWEPADDDPVEAKRLLMRLHVLLRDVATPVIEDPGAKTSAK
jgi:hypothetical protein